MCQNRRLHSCSCGCGSSAGNHCFPSLHPSYVREETAQSSTVNMPYATPSPTRKIISVVATCKFTLHMHAACTVAQQLETFILA